MTDPSAPPPPLYPPYPPPPPAAAAAAATPIATPRPPRKWLGPKGGWLVFLGFTAFWAANLLFNWLVLHHPGLSPNTMILGGFGMTGALLYTVAYRARPQDGITPVRLILAFVLGGLLATEFAAWIEISLEVIPIGPVAARDLAVRSLAGVIEEACKLLAVVLFARGLTNRSPRTGLFLGGAVGLGFAAFEDMKYALAYFDQPIHSLNPVGSLILITLGRDALGPFEHPVFTALLAAALFAASRGGRFRITPKLVGVYLLIAAGHGLIDAAPSLLSGVLHNRTAAGYLGVLVDILIALTGSVIWLRYARRLKRAALAEDAADYASASPVGSTAVGSSSDSPPTGSPFQ